MTALLHIEEPRHEDQMVQLATIPESFIYTEQVNIKHIE